MESILNINDVLFNYYFFIGGLFLSYLVYRILNTVLGDNSFLQTKYPGKGHTWRSIQCNKSIPYSIHCTICGKLMLPLVGLFCECCAISACKRCHWVVDKKFRCKVVSWQSQNAFYHHWVNVGGSRGEGAESRDDVFNRFFCSWCQRTRRFHGDMPPDTEECDFQKYSNIIIPPSCVLMEKGRVKSIKPLMEEEWEPLIILANRKSGSNRSDEVLSLFRGLLNPIQLGFCDTVTPYLTQREVFSMFTKNVRSCINHGFDAKVVDISVTSPERVVRWLPDRCRLLVAGGDGTVAWVLNALYNAPHVKASVAILPMGTGNDLSRVLGWGPGCVSHLDAHSIISSLNEAIQQPLDRWKVSIKPRGRLGRLRAERAIFAYNYASIGVDAQVALDFHRARAQFLYRYANRTLNYIAYAFLGVGRALDAGSCGELERRLRVWCGGTQLQLPPLQALVALNIPSWGAGVDLWSMGNEGEVGEQRINDGKLEIVGISSSFHIARLQCGLAEPYRFRQSSNIMIELDSPCAMQVDGEPWMQGPATIFIEPAGQSLMLRANINHSSE